MCFVVGIQSDGFIIRSFYYFRFWRVIKVWAMTPLLAHETVGELAAVSTTMVFLSIPESGDVSKKQADLPL
jgi:hypothetical protein